jgi:hypothetical protein
VAASPFTKKASNQSSDDFELPPAGLHPAAFIGLVDLGTHDHEYQGNKYEKRTLFVAWELIGTKNNNGEPFVVGQDYNDSLGKKSNWRKLLEGLRGRPFNNDEEFDPVVLLGFKCVINISIGMSKNDKKFSEVTSASMPMVGQAIPDPVNSPFAFHLSTWGDPKIDPDIPAWMPRSYGHPILDDIKDSKEWLQLEGRKPIAPQSNGHAAPSVHQDPRAVAQSMAQAPVQYTTPQLQDCPF